MTSGVYCLLSYPRSGNTLMRTYLATLQGRSQPSTYRGDVLRPSGPGLTAALDHLTLVKSHHFSPRYQHVVYLVRDGRNAMLSHLFLQFLHRGHAYARLEQVTDGLRHLADEGHFWGDHVRRAVAEAGWKRVLFLRYEDLVARPLATLRDLMGFLGVELADPVLEECVRRVGARRDYFKDPFSGYAYRPDPGSIYDLLQRHRAGDYWRVIFDATARRFFHERGGTDMLLRFRYERSASWIALGGAPESPPR